ncbi:xanthine dehydrogenase family protein molybdopterin-binding subunit [Runella limosa]|jgi:isoquinoline 1-oxidoreductase beta subunit|uniref:xanthine dehydrogenase family protein molybdopterin-binding subunit n=1 Tax=Runella limosa TaxID=370978 RepID=UPI00042548B7|nr:xanthine dehydrogenase family protein molybdopterin-binding subunit [Runella limosa]MCA0229125.1 xanthine dehydrogenase family protein molybdopterin-binding subunit [Bacteroidota bacterium]
MSTNQSRRDFFKTTAAAGGGLVLGFSWFSSEAFQPQVVGTAAADAIDFNAYLAISPSGTVTIFSPNPEIGQGIKTAFPIIVAEELDADWEKVKVEQSPLDTKKFERQLTGGSGAIRHSWERLRKAGATARALLIEAAAQQWGVPASECNAQKGMVVHSSGKKLSYGDLAVAASKLPVPKEVKLKATSSFSLIGSRVKGVDNKDILTGKNLFGIDYKRPGMLHAQVQRPPAFGLKLKSFDATEAKKMPGIVNVVSFGNKVAIVGKTNWEVMQARKAVKIEWEKEKDLESSADHDRLFKEMLNGTNVTVQRKDGDVEAAFKNAHKVIEAEYQCPFLPHSPMEPMNFFAHFKGDSIELAGPSQTPEAAQKQIAKMLNIAPEKVTLELTRMGGGFGRRLNTDYAVEAAELSSIIKAPVKVTWTREDDMTGGIYRPAVRYRFKASIDKAGNMTGFMLHGAGMNAGNSTRQDNFPAGAVDNLLIQSSDHKSPITTGPWRAPITNFLAYAEQAFLDEVAAAAGKDPVQFRLELLDKAEKSPVGKITYETKRFREVIKLAAEKSGWGKKKKGISQGFSVYFSHASYVAQVAEMTMAKGKPVLKKVYAAVDCGIVINESSAKNQIYGAIVDGIGHAMYGNLTFKDGAPQQENFNKYRLIRYNEVPDIEAHFVNNGIEPTGLGEPALPPTGGALANAIFKTTGKRLYNQPFADQDGPLG